RRDCGAPAHGKLGRGRPRDRDPRRPDRRRRGGAPTTGAAGALRGAPPETGVTRQLTELLADNWVVALVADRALGGRGVKVEMFGSTRTLPSGPAMLSLSTGAPLLVCPVSTTEDGWR